MEQTTPIKTTIAKWCVLSLLLAYAVGMAVWANAESDRHVCTGIDINIKGDSKVEDVTRQGVMAQLSRYPRKIVGQHFNSVNTLDIENYLKGFSNFENVECVLNAKGHLVVDIVPMVPEIRIFDGNRSYYVNKDGIWIAATAEFFTDVPVVQGHFNKQFPPTYVLPLTRFITSDPDMNRIASYVVAVDRDNLMIVPRIAGHIINFGDTTRLAAKRDALLTAYRNILPYRGWETYDTISVKFRNQIVATRRNKAPLHPLVAITEEADPEEANLPEEASPDLGHQPDR